MESWNQLDIYLFVPVTVVPMCQFRVPGATSYASVFIPKVKQICVHCGSWHDLDQTGSHGAITNSTSVQAPNEMHTPTQTEVIEYLMGDSRINI